MNNNQAQVQHLRKYDTAFINPCIDRVTEAIGHQNSGQKVLLVFENQLNRNDSFQLTQTFPLRLFGLYESVRKKRLWKQLFLLCPHLVGPQKVIYFQPRRAKLKAKIVDRALNNNFIEKSVAINKATPSNLPFLKTGRLKGIVFQEYKINVSRLFIELLKYFEINGGKILMKESFKADEISTIIQCSSENKHCFQLDIEVPENFALVKQLKKPAFGFFENSGQLQVHTLNPASSNLPSKQILQRINEVVSFNSESAREVGLASFLSTKTISNILKVVTKQLPGGFNSTKKEDYYELGLEKFDIAKQTGITYPEFKILFHRYGTGIDEMIDKAYENMEKTRNPQKVWKETENWFQKKYEWKY